MTLFLFNKDHTRRTRGLYASVAVAGIVAAAAAAFPTPGASEQRVAQATGRGIPMAASKTASLSVPPDYRTAYEFLGSWSVAGDKGSKEVHLVYASPGTVDGYNRNGHFQDGAILVKEVFEATTADMTTGVVSRPQALKGWFVMMRDSRNTHPDNALWGDGWGWSWFDAVDRVKTTSTNYKKDCQGCHIPAQSTEWIYVQGYALLKH
jgi:hypothetical protein